MQFQIAISVMLLGGAAAAQPLAFEVASVKVTTPPDYGAGIRMTSRGGPGTADPGRWTCEHMPLSSLILTAYQLQQFQLAAPPWMNNAYFEIVAKLPAGATRDSFRQMLRTLLAERFRLQIRRESKEVPGYELIVSKGGPKLQPSPPLAEGESEVPAPPKVRPKVELGPDGYPVIPPGLAVVMTMGYRARRQAIRESMDDLARNLGAQVGRPVSNATGIPGKFDFTISWIYEGPGAPAPPAPGDNRPLPPAADPSGPTLFRAIQEQLGLKLEPKRIAVDFLTVEGAERTPIEN